MLTEKRFNTFSIQAPVLANGVDADQYEPLFNKAKPNNQITIGDKILTELPKSGGA